MPPPLHLGVAPKHAQVRARRVDEDTVAGTVEFAGERFHPSGARVDDRETEARGGLADPRQSRRLRVERDDAAAVVHELGEMRGLGAGGGADVGDRAAGLGRQQARDQHRRLVLHGEATVGERTPVAGRPAGTDHEPFRRQARGLAGEPLLEQEPLAERLASRPAGVRAKRERRTLVERPHQRFGLVVAIALHPPLDEPGRERAARSQGVETVSRRRRLALADASVRERSEDRVDECLHARRVRRQRDRVVDDGERGHALQEGDLVGGRSQDHPDPEVERVEAPP